MDAGWLVGFIIVIVIILVLVGFAFMPSVMTGTITPQSRQALQADPPAESVVVPVQQQVVRREVAPAPPVESPDEEEGESVSSNLDDEHFRMKSDYPGMQGEELVLTKPLRRSIKLCCRGGFLRRYGAASWRHIPYITVDNTRVYYSKTGFFRIGESHLKRVVLRYDGQNYVLEIVAR